MVRVPPGTLVFDEESGEMLADLGYCARQLDLRAIKKFGLATIEPLPNEAPGPPDNPA